MRNENADNEDNYFSLAFDKIEETNYDSDVNSNDFYDENDFFNDKNPDYVKASPYPTIKAPSSESVTKREIGNKRKTDNTSGVQIYKFHIQKFDTLENLDFNRNSDFENNLNVEEIINNFQISFNLKYDISLSKYDNFSKSHHRDKLFKLLNDIDWALEYKIEPAKKQTNPYEDIFEGFFHRNLSVKMANLNNLFSYNLFVQDYYLETTPVMLVGDDGGLTDYILWHSVNEGITTNLFVIEDKSGKYSKTKFRKEIEAKREESVVKYDFPTNKQLDIDEDDLFSLDKVDEIIMDVLSRTSNLGISFYVARKKLVTTSDYFPEMKYKKFLFLNILLSFSTLSKGGNLVIKIYDMFTSFTVSVLYLLFNYFESFTVVKPYSLRPHSASRYVVCQRFTEFQPKIIQYLRDFYEQYCGILKQGKDIEFIYPISKILKDEAFKNYIMEINSQIIEGRIEALEELKSCIENPYLRSKYDKLDIKKRCLTLWKIPILNFGPPPQENNGNKKGNIKNERNKVPSIQELARAYTDIDTYESNIEMMIGVMSGSNSKPQNSIKKPNPKPIEEKSEGHKDKSDDLISKNVMNKSGRKPNSIQMVREQIIREKKNWELMNNNNNNEINKVEEKKKVQNTKEIKKRDIEKEYVDPTSILNKKRKAEEFLDRKNDKKEPSIKIKIPLLRETEEERLNTNLDIDLSNEDNKNLPESKKIELMELKIKQAAEENKKLSTQKLSINNLNLQELNKFKKKH